MRQLNSEQMRAVRHFGGPMLVLAGPGSGKTFTLVERIRYLIEARDVKPSQILTITFSKKASIEMRTRFYDLVGSKFYPVTFGTFHSIFYNILKAYHNYQSDSIITSAEKITYMKRVLRKHDGFDAGSDDAVVNMISKISAYKSSSEYASSFITSGIGISNNANNTLDNNFYNTVDCSKFNNNINNVSNIPDSSSQDCINTDSLDKTDFFDTFESEDQKSEFLQIFDEYDRLCKADNKIDFDDMIVMCLQLLKENSAVLSKWQGIFKYFLVDEFQDINDMQYEVLMLLAGYEKNIFAVGDDDQSIYGFRGSKPELMKRFLELENCKVVDMYKNYRCAEDVIAAAGCLISCNKERIVKNQISCKDDKSGTVHTGTFSSENEEADFVINKLLELRNPDGAVKDTAILYRTERCVSLIEEKLKLNGITYLRTVKQTGFYESEWVKDIISYLKIAVDEYETSDIYRILNKPDRGISREEVYELEYGLHNTASVPIFDSQANTSQGSVHTLISDITFIRDLSCFAAVNYILKGLGYYRYMQKENIKQGIDKAATDELVDSLLFRAKQFPNIQSWLEYIEDYLSIENKENEKPDEADTTGKVVLQTAHSSKGLEYDTVFVIGLMEGLFPHHKARTDSEIEEERRLMYVAMTRAKKTLYILGRGEEKHGKRVSRFIDEVKTCGKSEDIKV